MLSWLVNHTSYAFSGGVDGWGADGAARREARLSGSIASGEGEGVDQGQAVVKTRNSSATMSALLSSLARWRVSRSLVRNATHRAVFRKTTSNFQCHRCRFTLSKPSATARAHPPSLHTCTLKVALAPACVRDANNTPPRPSGAERPLGTVPLRPPSTPPLPSPPPPALPVLLHRQQVQCRHPRDGNLHVRPLRGARGARKV